MDDYITVGDYTFGVAEPTDSDEELVWVPQEIPGAAGIVQFLHIQGIPAVLDRGKTYMRPPFSYVAPFVVGWARGDDGARMLVRNLVQTAPGQWMAWMRKLRGRPFGGFSESAFRVQSITLRRL